MGTNVQDMSAFLKQNVVGNDTKCLVVSDRFLDGNGDPIKWEIKLITADDDRKIEKHCTTEKRDRRTGTITQIRDDGEYVASIAAWAVVYPDLKNKDVQKSWGADSPVDLLRKMLSSGELLKLSRAVLKLSGLSDEDIDEDVELDEDPISEVQADADHAKNS